MMTSKTGFIVAPRNPSSSLDAEPRDLDAKPGKRLAMLALDVGKGALEQLAELLVSWLERRIRQVGLGHELTIPGDAAPRTDDDDEGTRSHQGARACWAPGAG